MHPSARVRYGNRLLIGLIPGGEPSKHLNEILAPIVRDLLVLQDGTVFSVGNRDEAAANMELVVYCLLAQVNGDDPGE